MSHTPLIGQTLASLDDLFSDFIFVTAKPSTRGGTRYDAPRGYYFFGGVPGAIDVHGKRALYAKPHEDIVDLISRRCCNGVIGSFRAVRSAYWMKEGLLPIRAFDAHQIANILVGYVPYREHERFGS